MLNPEKNINKEKEENPSENLEIKEETEESKEKNSLERLEKKIKEAKKNSEKLKVALKEIDSYFFPNQEIPVKFKEEIKRGAGASHHFEKDDSGDYTEHYYGVNKSLNKEETNQASLLNIAIHEIRHRLQHDKDLELFDRENIKNFQRNSQVLKNFQEKTGGSFREKIEELHENKGKQLSPNDFDAVVVADLVEGLLRRYDNISSSEMIEKLVGENAKEIIKKLDEFAEKDKRRE